uniref:Uncharacterized protein n=1 Tax=Noccaea caerulescens TaxID=107243 RepID=A0A1J3IWH8_NOCCA
MKMLLPHPCLLMNPCTKVKDSRMSKRSGSSLWRQSLFMKVSHDNEHYSNPKRYQGAATGHHQLQRLRLQDTAANPLK